jgi:PPOX class probable F420-dependent enzyme
MSVGALPDPATEFGQRVRRRLHDEKVIWLTTVGSDATPQPNPVGFLFDGQSSILVYSEARARRLDHVAQRPHVALHLDGDGHGGDIVVLTGRAELAHDVPPADANDAWLAKYRDGMTRLSGRTRTYSERFAVPVRIAITRVRGR